MNGASSSLVSRMGETASMEAISESETPASALPLAHVFWLLTLGVLGVGLVLRLRGFAFHTIPLWEDEAAWAMRLVDLPLDAHDIRPLGFMAASKVLVSLFSPSEAVLRALPWLAGLVTLALAPLLANRLFSAPAARLLFVAVIALHPAAVDLSKEFKPYSVGLALHMGLLLLALRFFAEGKARDLLPLLGLLLVGTLFSQDAVFTYPGTFALLAVGALRARRFRQLAAIALAGLMALGLLLTLYFAFWRHCVGEQTTDYWGKKYDVFYVPNAEPPASRARWTAEHALELAALPGMRREHWRAPRLPESVLTDLKQVDVSVWHVLAVLGAAVLLWRRRPQELLLLLAPLGVLVAFNALGFWPLGAFRTNLFVLVYVAAIAAAAFDRPRAAVERWDLVPASALVIAPFLLLGNTTHNTKWAMSADSAFPQALQALLEMRGGARPRAELALDGAACPPFRYYTRYHPRRRRLRRVNDYFDAHCARDLHGLVRLLRKGLTDPESRAFALLGRSRSMDEIEHELPPDLQIDAQAMVGKHDQLVVRVKRR